MTCWFDSRLALKSANDFWHVLHIGCRFENIKIGIKVTFKAFCAMSLVSSQLSAELQIVSILLWGMSKYCKDKSGLSCTSNKVANCEKHKSMPLKAGHFGYQQPIKNPSEKRLLYNNIQPAPSFYYENSRCHHLISFAIDTYTFLHISNISLINYFCHCLPPSRDAFCSSAF